MARPSKKTVTYFPHDTDASHGRTLTILYNRYGNDGTAFWWNLLELLGRTPEHYFSFANPVDLEFLLAETHQKDTETLRGMLNLLAITRAIDEDLLKHDVIWCQNFVNRVNDAYSRTVDGIPQKPVIVNKSGKLQAETPIIHTETTENDTLTTQKEKEKEKEKEKKRNKTETKNDRFVLPDWINSDIWDGYMEVRKKQKAVPTLKAKQLLIKDLENFKLSGDDPNEIINQSIKNSWKGLFPIKDGGNNGRTGRDSKAFHTPERYTRPEEL